MRGHNEGVEAAGSVAGDGTIVKIRGATAVRFAAGTYDVTLDRPLPAADGIFQAQVRTGAADANCTVTHTSDTVKRVTTHVGAGAAANAAFDFKATRISNGITN